MLLAKFVLFVANAARSVARVARLFENVVKYPDMAVLLLAAFVLFVPIVVSAVAKVDKSDSNVAR